VQVSRCYRDAQKSAKVQKVSTIESFTLKASVIHKNRYSYLLSEYKTSKCKISIICPIHGLFSQIPHDHLMGHGCPKCAIEKVAERKRHSLYIFIEKAVQVHGGNYDYSLVSYKNSKHKVQIICHLHGIFEQSPNHHLKGVGCLQCGIERAKLKNRLSVEDFISRSQIIHNYKYDYSKAKFNNTAEKAKIVCPIHGIFTQRVNSHLNGCGCPICAIENFKPKNKLNSEIFIKRSKAIHNNKYDYSLVNYINNTIMVNILCPLHSIFYQTPNSHLDGNGCPKCAIIYKAKSLRYTQEEFIVKAIAKHGNKYDYSNAIYVDAKTKVQISCKKHGAFFQQPGSHLSGAGCPTCLESHGESFIATILDNHKITYEREKKFSDCRVDRPLSFDFYIPSLNTCIEYDGGQHFFPCKYFGGDHSFKKIQMRDEVKNNYCRIKNIKLIRLFHKDSSVVIEDIIGSLLKTEYAG
jgi:hypothetical protein